MVSRKPWRTRKRSVVRALVAMGCAVAATVIAALTLALPGQAQQPVPFEEIPILSAGVDGPVWVSELVGNELWIGGEFDNARDYAPGSPEVATSGLAVIDINTGALVPKTYDVPGEVLGIEYHDDTIWVVGEFWSFDGTPVNHIVAIDAFTGQRRTDFIAASGEQLRDVIYHQGWLYLGGNPGTYNGTGVANVFRVDPSTGALDTSWNPQVSRFVESLDAFGDLVAVSERSQDLKSETKLISTITALKVDGLDAGSKPTSGMWDAEFSSDGGSVYLAETGNSIVKYTVADELLWVSERADGDMQAVAASGDVVFAGFHEGWDDNEERHIVALDAATGQLQPWFVQTNSYWGVRGIEIYDQGLVALGEFTTASGVNARRVAIFRPTGPWVEAEALEVEVEVVQGDVNCDDLVDVTDALYLVQYSVDNRTPVINCDSLDPATGIYADAGDVDGDGAAGVIDAMLIAQCSVGNPNVFCPAE